MQFAHFLSVDGGSVASRVFEQRCAQNSFPADWQRGPCAQNALSVDQLPTTPHTVQYCTMRSRGGVCGFCTYSITQCSTTQHNTIHYNATLYGAVQNVY